MKDKLERFISDNKEQFEESFDASKGWDAVTSKIGKPKQRKKINWYAAASVLLVFAVVYLLLERNSFTTEINKAEFATIDGRSYTEIEDFYTQQISLKRAEVKKNSSHIDYPLTTDIDTIQQNYSRLKLRLKKSGVNEKLLNAMILNLRTQIELLNEQLSIIEHINKYIETENKENNETHI